jgi:26S proteasome regulatory subunit N2
MVSSSGFFRRTAIVAMALFLQYWYWFPMAYLLPLSFKMTALIGVTEDLKLPKFQLTCNCKKGLYAYAKPVADNAKKKVLSLLPVW